MGLLERRRHDTNNLDKTSAQLPNFNSQITHRGNWIGHPVVGAAPHELKLTLEGGRHGTNQSLQVGVSLFAVGTQWEALPPVDGGAC